MGAGASTAPSSDGSSSAMKRAVLICHSSQECELRSRLSRFDCTEPLAVVTESFPADLQARADVLAGVDVAVLAIDAAFQRSMRLVETASFLKDARIDVLAGPLTFHSRPSGAVGAICFALGVWEPELFSTDALHVAASATAALTFVTAADVEQIVARTRSDNEMAAVAAQDRAIAIEAAATEESCIDSSNARVLYVFAGADGECVASTFAALDHTSSSTSSVTVAVELCASESPTNDLAALARAHVAAFVLTAASMQDTNFRRLLEAAVRWQTPVLPIRTTSERMTGWLAMCMAGRLWYEVAVDALEQIHTPYAELPHCACKVHDSCLATDYLQCLAGLVVDQMATDSNAIDSVRHDDTDSLSSAQWSDREVTRMTLCCERAGVTIGRTAVDALCVTVCDAVAVLSDDTSDSSDCSKAKQQLLALGVAIDAASVALQVVDEARTVQSLAPTAHELLPPVEPSLTNPDLKLSMIQYKVTRSLTKRAPVPQVVDTRGNALPALVLDAMLSYQWNDQPRVLALHQQGDVARLRAWLDVFGFMSGNVNAAMATAVEHVACVVVFLSHTYIQSVNCRLEFAYARAWGAPMVLAFIDDPRTLVPLLPSWVTEAVGTFSVYPSMALPSDEAEVEVESQSDGHDSSNSNNVLALDLTSHSYRNVPVPVILLSAIRQLAAARYRSEPRTRADGSLLLYATTRALHHAVTAASATAAATTAAVATTKCTRCSTAFDPAVASTLDGCRRHAAYYVGGTILAARWACCREPCIDGAGCEVAHHIAAPRVWTLDARYGTYTWLPA